MTYLEGAVLGVIGSAICQLLEVYEFRRKQKIWPWQDKKLGMTIPFFVFGMLVKLLAAALVVGMLVHAKEIRSIWLAAVAGMVADRIVLRASLEARKVYTR